MNKENKGGPRGNVVHMNRLCETFGLTLRDVPYARLGTSNVSLAFASAVSVHGGKYKYWYWSFQPLLREKDGPETDFVLLDGEESERHHYFLLGKDEIRQIRRLYGRKRKGFVEQLAVNIDKFFKHAPTWSDRAGHIRLLLTDCEKTEDQLTARFKLLLRKPAV